MYAYERNPTTTSALDRYVLSGYLVHVCMQVVVGCMHMKEKLVGCMYHGGVCIKYVCEVMCACVCIYIYTYKCVIVMLEARRHVK
jgi:hypothetical protein